MQLSAAVKITLKVTIVVTTCLIVLHGSKVKKQTDEEEEIVHYGVQEIEVQEYQQGYNENQKLLIFLYRLDCDTCPQALNILTKLSEHPELPKDIRIVKSFNYDLASRLDIENVPCVVYLRDKSYVIYDGNFDVKDLLSWIPLASKKIVQRLNDESLPLLVKSDTKEITDDWLVVFYKETCKSVLPVIETAAVRVHGQIKVAKVNILESPELTYKFEVTECPEIILFKQGKMYKYSKPTVDAASLKDFVGGSYRKESQIEPNITSETDFFTKSIKEYMKHFSRGDNKPVIVAGLGCVVVLLLLTVCCCCRAGKKHRRKKEKKEKKQ